MDQILDLGVILTRAPDRSPPGVLANFAIDCQALNLHYSGGSLIDPLAYQERNDLRWYLEEYPQWPYEGFAERGQRVEMLLQDVGKRLYQAILGSVEAQRIVQRWQALTGAQHQISIVSEAPGVLSLSWELLHDGRGFLALRRPDPISIVRRLPQHEYRTVATSFDLPLRVLLITSRPEDERDVDPRIIARELVDEVQAHIKVGAIELEFLRPPTLSALQLRLQNTTKPVHVLHFDGHGAFDDKKAGQGILFFETSAGSPSPVPAALLAQVVRDSGIHLAILTACRSATSAADDAFSSVAAQLLQSGVGSVVAMSANVLVTSAARYVEALYRALAAGIPPSGAHAQAQLTLHDDPRRHLFRRHRDEEGSPVELCDWWLPHFYQQHPFILQATKIGRDDERPTPTSPSLSPDVSLPAAPRYGFHGRGYELLQIERSLTKGQLVVIHGFGGAGKTALACEAADWFTRTGMYKGACFVSFEHGEDAGALLKRLAMFLNSSNEHFHPGALQSALAQLAPTLEKMPLLIIADSLEGILPRGESPLNAAALTQLWSVLLALRQMGAGMLLTTRDTAFDDRRLLPGSQVTYIDLQGLHSRDAFALASSVLIAAQIARARIPYGELRDLLVQLDHHPLAIELVLPALREVSLAAVRTDFAALLARFVDNTTTGRKQSLVASLEYSLQRLSRKQRAMLSYLAPFERGALEIMLPKITEMPREHWEALREALAHAALLTTEEIDENLVPYLHFHPVLTPYLRTQPGAHDQALLERYVGMYYAFAEELVAEYDQRPLVRAVVRCELPNLRRVLELLLEKGELDLASVMARRIARFLGFLGLGRERDELWQRMNASLAAMDRQIDGELSHTEYLLQLGFAKNEFEKGNLQGAYQRFSVLLARIESLSGGRGSYEQCEVLHWLARCLGMGGQPVAAEELLRQVLDINDALLQQNPLAQNLIDQRRAMLSDLASSLRDRGEYMRARKAYEDTLQFEEQQENLRGQAETLINLGVLANLQEDYAEASARFQVARKINKTLGDPQLQADILHNLGTVALSQKEWTEAEQYLRASLALEEQQGDLVGAGKSYNHLGIATRHTGRPAEAERWWKRALELDEEVRSESPEQVAYLGNLAGLLLDEVRTGRMPRKRLAEAQRYAERALAMTETLAAPLEIWETLGILAGIADLERRTKDAREYRRRERQTYVDFPGNRFRIEHTNAGLINHIVEAAQGDLMAWVQLQNHFEEAEDSGWQITTASLLLLSGERDWNRLTEPLNRHSALLFLLVLERLERQKHPLVALHRKSGSVTIAGKAYVDYLDAVKQGDRAAIEQVLLENLSPEELLTMGTATDVAPMVQQLEPLLEKIVSAASGNIAQQERIKAELALLEQEGWHISSAVEHFWAGERDGEVLAQGLSRQDAALVYRLLTLSEQLTDGGLAEKRNRTSLQDQQTGRYAQKKWWKFWGKS